MATKKNTFEVYGQNTKALFSLKLYRGEGMALLAMNWKKGKPTKDFVGFAIEYKEPNGEKFYALKNRISFLDKNNKPSKTSQSTLQAPIQKFRWVHFPRNADMKGEFEYVVKPVFMNNLEELSYGEAQQVSISLHNETYNNKLNVTFTRGFVISQAFADKYEPDGGIATLLPAKASLGLDFKPTHPKAEEALPWMGFEARQAILDLLDKAIADKDAEVKVITYDLNEPIMVKKLEKLGTRLSIIIDDSGEHHEADSGETQSFIKLKKSTKNNVKRQNMGQLQHNKIIIVNGPKVKAAICGSTNFSWRGFFVQANNAVVIQGAKAIKPFLDAYDSYWQYDSVKDFSKTASANWNTIPLTGIDAKLSFSPHSTDNALLEEIAKDMENKTSSSLFYSLAFIYQTKGNIREAIERLTEREDVFVYGISDKKVGGLDIQKPNGNLMPVYPSDISKNLPEPFKSESKGGFGNRMHHKFVVIDFNKPTARVYLGSYNFSKTADTQNGENLLLIKDRKVAVSYMIEALRIFDHYHFRVALKEAKKTKEVLSLAKPPKKATEKTWWDEYYTDKRKIKDREMFAK